MGRRFWYDAYSSSLDVVLGSLDEIAAEQRKRECRRRIAKLPSQIRGPGSSVEYMRDQLAAAFEEG